METKPELELAARTTAFVCEGFNDFRQWNFSSILSNPEHFAGNHGGTSCGMGLGMFIPPFFEDNHLTVSSLSAKMSCSP